VIIVFDWFLQGLRVLEAAEAAHRGKHLTASAIEMYRDFSCPLPINLAEATLDRVWTKSLL
jgi:hypothetical protein